MFGLVALESISALMGCPPIFLAIDLRNICTEAGMFAIRDERDYIVQDDLNKAVRKLQEAKKHECKLIAISNFNEPSLTKHFTNCSQA